MRARRFGVGVIMTSPECRNGTERCAEALAQLHGPDLVINFQGDALLTPPGFVEALIARMESDRDALVATPAMRLRSDEVRALQAEEAAGRVGGTTRCDRCRRPCALFLEAADPAFARRCARRRCRRCDCMSASMPIGPKRSNAMPRRRSSELELLEGLEQLRFLAAGIPSPSSTSKLRRSRLRELNNPEDVAPIEQALAEAGLE